MKVVFVGRFGIQSVGGVKKRSRVLPQLTRGLNRAKWNYLEPPFLREADVFGGVLSVKNNFRSFGILATSALLSLSLAVNAATELYVKNKPFKGVVASAEGQLWVELPSFAKALGADLASNAQGGHALGKGASADGVPANTVMVAGTPVEVKVENGVTLISLQKIAPLLNAKLISNKEMGTIDFNVGGPVQAYTPPAPAPDAAAKNRASAPSNILRVSGKVTVEGANAVGLFENGSAIVPYKKGRVDKKGNYTMEIDLAKDLHDGETDMRFYQDGAFEMCHGRCNFIFYNPKTGTAVLSPYGSNQQIESKNGQLQYSESNE